MAIIKASVEGTKVVTGKVRASYAHVFQPREGLGGGDPKYSICALIPKTDKDTLQAIKKAILNAAEEGKAKFNGTKMTEAKLMSILHDGDAERDGDEYKGMYYINASSKQRPAVVDKNVQPIIDPDEFYSGCYCRLSLNFYAYSVSGNKGVGCGLNHIQKIADGENLTGRPSAESTFSALGDDEDDGTFDFLS